jgi:tricorn protease
MFALGIQQLKIGTVVGERTWGGAIGYSGHPELRLVDGSGFTIPSFGPYLDGDWAIEQKGVTPDVKVSNLPVNTFKGGDAQLDKAIELINDMIAKSDPVALPPPPKYPIRAFNAAQCSAAAAQPISDAF